MNTCTSNVLVNGDGGAANPSARVLKVDPSNIPLAPAAKDPVYHHPALEAAKRVLLSERPVAIPTETVYGLAAISTSTRAIQAIFSAKERPMDNPLILHVSSLDMLRKFRLHIPAKLERAVKHFWPGPLTVILKKPRGVFADEVTGGQKSETVAVRMPAHPFTRCLIAAVGIPLAAPSANISGRPSPTTAQHVYDDLAPRIPLIIDDGGQCELGLESTVVSVFGDRPRILRTGALDARELEKYVEDLLPFSNPDGDERGVPVAPGMKYKHYSPCKPVTLIDISGVSMANMREVIEFATKWIQTSCENPRTVGLLSTVEGLESLVHTHVSLGKYDDPEEAGRRVFKGLRDLDDEKGVESIVVIGCIGENAVNDRLRKASSRTIVPKT